MKLRIQFAEEISFDVSIREKIRTWMQLLSGTRLSLHAMAMAEQPGTAKPHAD